MELSNDWQNVDDVIKSNQMMLDSQYGCDVTFLLGNEAQRLGAHQFVLVSRSPVFGAMFCGSMAADGGEKADSDICVPDVDIDDFKSFLKYLYTGSTEIVADNVIPLLYASKKYAVTGLSTKCLAFVENHLDSDNACAVLEQAHFFDEQDFHDKVLRVILRKGEEVLDTDDVTQLCEKCVGEIVGSDNLMAKEDQVLQACIRWAQAQCTKQDLAVTDSNCRIMLGSTLYKIRFPLLEPTVFVKRVASGDLLTEEEKVDVMGRFIVPTRPSKYFPTSIRIKSRHLRLNRFQKRSEAVFNNKSGSSAISFEVNRDIYLEGFAVYGSCRAGTHQLEVKGRIVDTQGKELCCLEKEVLTSADTDIYDVTFDESQRLQAATIYTLVADISVSGSHTFGGCEGRIGAFTGDAIFSFTNSDTSQTGTSVTYGQLPSIIFSLV